MKGTTITLKNVPPELHHALKEQAKRHKRSLNQETIFCLESALSQAGKNRSSLSQAPLAVSVGKILLPLANRADRQSDLLEREA